MKPIAFLISLTTFVVLLSSCTKDLFCDIHQYTGGWQFIVNNDSTTLYQGNIERLNDHTLNVHYQNDYLSTVEDNSFKQLKVTSCSDGTFESSKVYNVFGYSPVDSIERYGSINCNSFEYVEIYTGKTFDTNEPYYFEKRIIGTKIN